MISLQSRQHFYSAIKWIYLFKGHEREQVLIDKKKDDVFCHLEFLLSLNE